jgi:hypothetical protein
MTTIAPPMTVSRHSTPTERQAALYAIYQQVLERQPYAHERKHLAKIEKEFLSDKIGVRRFLKELGQSQVYLDNFYHNSSNMKFLECCFKHFLGRAPMDQAEIGYYCDVLMHKGVLGMITALLDSDEYRKAYGCFTVPFARELGCYTPPRAYLESNALNHELNGRRGRSIPTMYWHQLGLDCEAGVCQPVKKNRFMQPDLIEPNLSDLNSDLNEAAIADLLRLLGAEDKVR